MSDREDEAAPDATDALANDTVPEAPADELPSAASSDEGEASAPGEDAPLTHEGSADEGSADEGSADEGSADEGSADEGSEPDVDSGRDDEVADEPDRTIASPTLHEAPERAGRRVSRSGWRIGTRVTLGLVVASVLPTAAVLASLWFAEPPLSVDSSVLPVALGALAASVVLSLLVGLRLHAELSRALSALEARLRLLASGQPGARFDGKQAAELDAIDDVADLLAQTLGTLREREEAERERRERLFAAAERVDAIAHGQLATRLAPADDVAEASLAAAVNRLVDAFERRVVRLKSHTRALGSSAGSTPPAFDEGEDDPVALLEKRIGGLKPIPPLLHDIAGRLGTLSRRPAGDARVPDDLARLSDAVAQRARAAQALFDSLEANLPRLPRASGGEARGLTSDQQRALSSLVEDLEALTVDASLPRLVESLPDLSAGDVASRLARPKVDA